MNNDDEGLICNSTCIKCGISYTQALKFDADYYMIVSRICKECREWSIKQQFKEAIRNKPYDPTSDMVSAMASIIDTIEFNKAKDALTKT